ncbi:MAG: type II secretion system protein N [Lysobacterales bacterium]|nr:PDZ domain-containing protein [Xanthomonadales bacterium]MCP5476260.1 PDZ domain-containing protein [Rhodanobacteraceae bacterium]
MSAVLSLPRLTTSRWLPALVIALAALWMLLSVTRLLWQWLTPDTEYVPELPAKGAITGADSRLSLAQFRLFGSVVDPAGGAYADAPDTALKLTLRGTNSHHDQQLARAVIADEQQNEKIYKVGDQFGNGVNVQAIYPDRVVLNAAGRIEVLRLRQPGTGMAASSSRQPDPRSVVTPGANGLVGLNALTPSAPGSVNPMAMVTAPIDWEAVRQQAIADPSSIAKSFSVLPVMIDGKLAGFRVSSNTYGAQLAEAGLQPDDIVTAVNGSRLDSIEAGYSTLESLRTAGAVTLTVRRDGAEKTLPAIRMPQ